MGNVAKYQHGWNMTFTVVELLMIIPKSTYLSISLPYFSIYHFFSLTLLWKVEMIGGMLEAKYFYLASRTELGVRDDPLLKIICSKVSIICTNVRMKGGNSFVEEIGNVYK